MFVFVRFPISKAHGMWEVKCEGKTDCPGAAETIIKTEHSANKAVLQTEQLKALSQYQFPQPTHDNNIIAISLEIWAITQIYL